MNEPLHRQLGLRDDEHERIVATLGREPNRAELAMYAVMWSEHCSYKSSKIHLQTLPTEGPAVLVGPAAPFTEREQHLGVIARDARGAQWVSTFAR